MSLYNMLMGFNPACLLIMPMLGRKQEEYPRFRDCFISEENNIVIYTRVGGGNRNCGYGEEKLMEDEHFIKTYDDKDDSTYGYYEFNVPEKWKSDFCLIVDGKFDKVSKEYINHIKKFYPKLDKEGVINKMFEKSKQEKTNE